MAKNDVDSLMARISKQTKGRVTVKQLSRVRTVYDRRIGTGILDLDMVMKGGWICGTVNHMFGPDGSGKNLIVSYTVAEIQRTYKDAANVALISFGYVWDRDLLRKAGVAIEYSDEELVKMRIDPATATPEQRGKTIGNIITIELSDAESPAEDILDAALEIMRSGLFQLIVVDEMASGETADDASKALKENPRMASWASLVTRFCQKCYSVYRIPTEDGEPNATAVLTLQPVRANTDQMSAKFNKTTIPSGHALKHVKTMDLHIKPVGQIRSGDSVIGKKIECKVSKGKFGVSEGGVCVLDFIFFTPDGGGGFDPIISLVSTAEQYGTISRRGRFYSLLDYDSRFNGRSDLMDYLRQHPKIAEELREATVQSINADTGEVPYE